MPGLQRHVRVFLCRFSVITSHSALFSPPPHSSLSPTFMQYFLSLVSNSIFSLDLNIHQDALLLCGHLMAGACYAAAKDQYTSQSAKTTNNSAGNESTSSSSSTTTPSSTTPAAAGTDDEAMKWKLLSDRNVVPLVEDLLAHVVKCLNVLVHILEGTTPGIPITQSSTRPSLPSIPNAPSISSPIKRRR